jgi:hypothetical protein
MEEELVNRMPPALPEGGLQLVSNGRGKSADEAVSVSIAITPIQPLSAQGIPTPGCHVHDETGGTHTGENQ